jgi:hypothetical protein
VRSDDRIPSNGNKTIGIKAVTDIGMASVNQ